LCSLGTDDDIGETLRMQNSTIENRILARYMPDATVVQQDEARSNLRQLARILLRIENRLGKEWYAQRIRESGDAAVESSERPAPPL
jgi:hypothetical protein